MSPDPKKRRKPSKPYPTFPLTPHNNGQWCKKIRGKLHFFGVWEDPEAAHQLYLREAADLHAGREPRMTLTQEGITVKDAVNHYLTYQLRRAEAGEIGHRWFEDCRVVLEHFSRFTGTGRLAADLMADDFLKYRQKLVRAGISGRKGLGSHALNRAITVIQGTFKYAYEVDLIDRPIKYGKAFERPSATAKRKSRRTKELENGKRLFEAGQIRRMLDVANVPLRAMILLGINGGFGNSDCARLPTTAIDQERAVIEFDRPKTGVERVVPLWPETVAALTAVLQERPQPEKREHTTLLFLTGSGRPWVRDYVHHAGNGSIEKVVSTDSVGVQFERILRQLNLKRKGVGFYTLRHTFRTWADEVRDQHAIHRIMGHTIPGMSGIYVEEISLERLRAVVEHVRLKLFPPKAPVADQPTDGAA